MADRKKVVIWGAGEKAGEVYSSLDLEKCELVGVVDGNPGKQGKEWSYGIRIESPAFFDCNDIDYYIISVKSSDSVVRNARKMDIPGEKILLFWSDISGFVFFKREYIIQREEVKLKMRQANALYEQTGSPVKIMSNEELFDRLVDGKKSLSRFGDGEFEIIRGAKRGWFQKNDDKLAVRLKEIITSQQDKVLIGIADNFGNLDKYTEVAADGIREYLKEDVRKGIMEFLPVDRVYADAYITRPYFIYRDKDYIRSVVKSFKDLWKNRNIIMVESSFSRFGVGNDLFDGVNGIKRIICPNKDAFDVYDEIISSIRANSGKNDLILLSLGQTATVLAYDLGMEGYQAIDIGQLDTEYEWFLRNATDRIEIPGKSVAELSWWHEPEQLYDDEYENQIICEVRNQI